LEKEDNKKRGVGRLQTKGSEYLAVEGGQESYVRETMGILKENGMFVEIKGVDG